MSAVTRRAKGEEDPDEVVRCFRFAGAWLAEMAVLGIRKLVTGTEETVPQVLSLSTAARLLDLGESTLRACIQKGELAAYKVNGQYRIEKKELIAFEQRRKGGRP